MKDFQNRRPHELSGGQKQRVAIARALVKDPHIILADEPTGALDSETGKQVFETLKKLSRDKLVVVVSHDRDFALRYADRIIELSDGRVIHDTATDDAAQPEGSGRNLSLVKAKLPLKFAAKTAYSSIKRQKLRFAITVALSLISSPDKLIGKTIFLGERNYTITGIIDTHFDSEKYAQLTRVNAAQSDDKLDLSSAMLLNSLDYDRTYGLACAAFVGEGKIAEISSRYPEVVTIDDLTLSFENEYVSFSVSSFARLSDIDLEKANIQWPGAALDLTTDPPTPIEGDVRSEIRNHEIIVPLAPSTAVP